LVRVARDARICSPPRCFDCTSVPKYDQTLNLVLSAQCSALRRLKLTDKSVPTSLPAWIHDHLSRYQNTDGADGYLWDARLGGGEGMVPTLLLTTTGRKSGRPMTMPLILGRSGRSYVVVASRGGAPTHPAWYLNLQANPEVQVQVKAERFRARARTSEGAERAALWAQMVKVYAPYESYQKKTTRQIPVVVLDPL
jgi:deazaflavin-dependent oxidoreductase (nitroreductase family)